MTRLIPRLIVLLLMPSLAWGQTDSKPTVEAADMVLDRTSDPVWLDSLYQSGSAFGQFLEEAEARRERWVTNYGDGSPDASWTARADSLTGSWYLLAVAVDGCSDSVSTIPYLAHLAGYSGHIHMRVVLPESGRPIMEAHRTKDGRASTPTVLVLNEQFEPVGVFIERPDGLKAWVETDGADLPSREFVREKFAWYEADGGRETVASILTIIEGASKK